MYTAQELEEIKDYIFRELPKVLEQDPRFVTLVEGIVSEKFPRRDDFARLLDEFTSFRGETRENFKRVDERFEQVEQRLDRVDQRLEQVDQRFEQVDQRFEQMDRRFEQVDQRFEQVDQRFGQVRLDLQGLKDWTQVLTGHLQTRFGRTAEDIVASGLRVGLERPDVDPRNLRLRQKITDPEGRIFKPGRYKEVDLLIQDGELLVFEVKAAAKVEDVDDFADKVELIRLQNPDKQVSGIFISAGASEAVRQQCAVRGVRLVPSAPSD